MPDSKPWPTPDPKYAKVDLTRYRVTGRPLDGLPTAIWDTASRLMPGGATLVGVAVAGSGVTSIRYELGGRTFDLGAEPDATPVEALPDEQTIDLGGGL